jgi:surface polysaccharide O-acyltransferase-like enzyme
MTPTGPSSAIPVTCASASSVTSPRNAAIDIARCIAAFGVVVIHCAPRNPTADFFGSFFLNVCVPFFLLTSVFFFWVETERTGDAAGALRRRLSRLLLPYVAWTVIYVGARAAKTLLSGGPIAELFSPASLVAIVGTGGGAVHLYFLPLLMVALVLAWIAATVIPFRKLAGGTAVVLLIVTAASLFQSLEQRVVDAATPLGKLGFTYLDWAIWMVPMVVAAGVCATRRSVAERVGATKGWALIASAIVLDVIFVLNVVPSAWRFLSIVLAVLVLSGCLAFRSGVAKSALCGALLGVSFGVFLSHHLFLEGVEWIDERIGGRMTKPYTAASIAVVSLLVFAMSAVFTLAVQKRPRLARVLLGQ